MTETYVVHVTKNCNMNCFYCYEKDKSGIYTWEEVKNFIDNMAKYNTQQRIHIEFLGGEPMLAWDFIKKSYFYIENEYKDILKVNSYSITTNGTIVTDEVIKFLVEHRNVNFSISLDGNKWSNQLRYFKTFENSYDKVMENIEKLMINNITPSIHIVTHPFNVGYLYDSIVHLYEKGIRSLGIGTIESTMQIGEEYSEKFIEQLDLVSKDIVNKKLEGLNIDLFEWIKPRTDVRNYIKDDEGKVIGETYGRAGDDVSRQENLYNIVHCEDEDETSKLIYNIRRFVFYNHKKNLQNKNKEN
jgi:sulfatase maturation enzyme AslB (radical SAM superfamily)